MKLNVTAPTILALSLMAGCITTKDGERGPNTPDVMVATADNNAQIGGTRSEQRQAVLDAVTVEGVGPLPDDLESCRHFLSLYFSQRGRLGTLSATEFLRENPPKVSDFNKCLGTLIDQGDLKAFEFAQDLLPMKVSISGTSFEETSKREEQMDNFERVFGISSHVYNAYIKARPVKEFLQLRAKGVLQPGRPGYPKMRTDFMDSLVYIAQAYLELSQREADKDRNEAEKMLDVFCRASGLNTRPKLKEEAINLLIELGGGKGNENSPMLTTLTQFVTRIEG